MESNEIIMIKFLLAGVFLFTGLSPILAQLPSTPAPPPSVGTGMPGARFQFIGGEEYTFTEVAAGTDVEHVYKFKNIGVEPLIIRNVAASSSSVTATYKPASVPPGGTGEVAVVLHTTGIQGPVDKMIFIISNAPANRGMRYTLHIKGTVR